MDEREFIKQRQANWQRLETILQKTSRPGGLRALSRREVQELGPLYRRVSSDLAYARAHAVSQTLKDHLNALVRRSYSLFYQTDRRQWGGLLRFFTHDFPDTFRRRMPFFLASLGFLVIGGLIGYLLVAQAKDNIYLFLPPGSQLHDSVKYWESGQVTHKIDDGSAAIYASSLMQNNIRVSFVAFAGGLPGGFLTGYILFNNGAVLGAMAGLMTQVHQHHNFWPGILPHGIVEISETVIAGAAGLSLGWALLAPGRYRRKDALVLAARDSVKLVIGGCFLLIFAGLVEGFLSHSLLPKPFKITFGIASGIALYSYLMLAGREQGTPPPTSNGHVAPVGRLRETSIKPMKEHSVTQFDTDSRNSLTRREALRHVLTGAASLALISNQAQAARDDKPYGPFRMGIQSYSLRGYDFDISLDMTQKLGLHYWESFQAHIPLTDSRDKIAETLAKLKAKNIKLAAWGVHGFDGNETQARKVFDFAKMIGLQTISADPSKEAFPILDKLVEEYKINIAIHNHGPGARYDKLNSVLAAIQGHHPRIGACVDTGHALRSSEDPVAWVKALGKRVYGVHLKDVKGTTQFTEVGQGDLRTVDLFHELHKLKFPWLVSLEYEEHEKEVGPYIDLCLAATRDAIQKAINR